MTIERDYSDKDLRAALGSSPPLEKMKMGYSPIPWTAERQDGSSGTIYYAIHSAAYDWIANIEENKANAEFIVRAVNCHDELVGALTTIANSYATNPSDELRDMRRADYLELYLHEIRKMAREAIAKAKVQP